MVIRPVPKSPDLAHIKFQLLRPVNHWQRAGLVRPATMSANASPVGKGDGVV